MVQPRRHFGQLVGHKTREFLPPLTAQKYSTSLPFKSVLPVKSQRGRARLEIHVRKARLKIRGKKRKAIDVPVYGRVNGTNRLGRINRPAR